MIDQDTPHRTRESIFGVAVWDMNAGLKVVTELTGVQQPSTEYRENLLKNGPTPTAVWYIHR